MKDLDFDELDRAVNSLITNIPGSASSNDVASAPSAGSVAQEQPSSIGSTAFTTNARQTIQNSPSVGRPSTGRFMDVVHPSSDMRSSLVMPERTSNQNRVISNNLPMTQPDNLPVEIEEPSVPAKINNNWPDPIEYNHDSNNNVSEADKKDDDDIDQISNDITNSMNQQSNNPLESPFLTGTKIEKRPLGAFSDSAATLVEPQPTMVALPTSSPADQSDEIPETLPINTDSSSETSLPAELQGDLLSIESGDDTNQIDQSIDMPDDNNQMVSEPDTAEQSLNVIPVDNSSSNEKETVSQASETTPVVPVATSIQQQYKEQPNTGDQNNGAIYDTQNYHKAVAPVKKKSGLMWILWVFILLIVGVAAGAAVYFFVLPRL